MVTNEDFMPDQEELDNSPELVSQTEDEMYSHIKFVVDKGQTQMRIDKFLSDKLSKISRNKVQNAIRGGSVLVDNQVVAPNFKIKPNQTISIVFPDTPDDGFVAADNVPLDIVYEDDDVLLVNKPAGLVCHPGVGNRRNTLINGIAYYWEQKGTPFETLNPEDRPGLVHRIDKDTSGLLIIAKNQFALMEST
jgi:23S rRNA pseudouridine1911/1915/1917 synthase